MIKPSKAVGALRLLRRQFYNNQYKTMESKQELDRYGRPYPPKMDGYLVPRTAADAIVVRKNKQTNANEILMITRKKEPFKGRFAFPGGHIDYGEDPKDACLRELREECGIQGSEPELIDVRGNPLRDPRYHMISMFYLVKAPDNCEVTAGDDAETANWYNLNELASKKEMLAFDHHDVIVEKLLRRKEFQKL